MHRDIKTNNVLVDGAGSVKLIDFGIASMIGDTSDGYGGPMTIAYAAPEQLMGKSPAVGSDVFALGVLLHVLLVGEPPERKSDGSVQTHVDAIQNDDLVSIVSKATSFEEGDRYQSVTAFSDDVEAYLETRPVVARDGKGFYRFKKLVQRNALASSLAAAFVVALSGGMMGSLLMANKATIEAERANSELVRAEWALGRAEIREKVANSFGASLQQVFGDESDVKQLNATLLEYWQDIMDNPKTSDDERAIVSYALGEHFTARGDFVTGIKVLKPWIESDYGDRELRIAGKQIISRAFWLLAMAGRQQKKSRKQQISMRVHF